MLCASQRCAARRLSCWRRSTYCAPSASTRCSGHSSSAARSSTATISSVTSSLLEAVCYCYEICTVFIIWRVCLMILLSGPSAKPNAELSCVCLHADRRPDERKTNLERFKVFTPLLVWIHFQYQAIYPLLQTRTCTISNRISWLIVLHFLLHQLARLLFFIV